MDTKITTLLFDLDGTLINTNELIIASFLHTLNYYYPNKYERNDVIPYIGPPLTETFSKINPARVEEMVHRYRAHNQQHHDTLVEEYEGVYEAIVALKKAGFKLGIVTSKIREMCHRGMKLGRLEGLFDTVIAIDDVTLAKPNPEPIFKALEQLHSTPAETMMVGDNYHDILAGKNAGTLTVGVAWTMQGEQYLQSFGPDYMVNDMRDLLRILRIEGIEKYGTL